MLSLVSAAIFFESSTLISLIPTRYFYRTKIGQLAVSIL
jgi:hypothetical protein